MIQPGTAIFDVHSLQESAAGNLREKAKVKAQLFKFVSVYHLGKALSAYT